MSANDKITCCVICHQPIVFRAYRNPIDARMLAIGLAHDGCYEFSCRELIDGPRGDDGGCTP